jgi:hypothetical protein
MTAYEGGPLVVDALFPKDDEAFRPGDASIRSYFELWRRVCAEQPMLTRLGRSSRVLDVLTRSALREPAEEIPLSRTVPRADLVAIRALVLLPDKTPVIANPITASAAG